MNFYTNPNPAIDNQPFDFGISDSNQAIIQAVERVKFTTDATGNNIAFEVAFNAEFQADGQWHRLAPVGADELPVGTYYTHFYQFGSWGTSGFDPLVVAPASVPELSFDLDEGLDFAGLIAEHAEESVVLAMGQPLVRFHNGDSINTVYFGDTNGYSSWPTPVLDGESGLWESALSLGSFSSHIFGSYSGPVTIEMYDGTQWNPVGNPNWPPSAESAGYGPRASQLRFPEYVDGVADHSAVLPENAAHVDGFSAMMEVYDAADLEKADRLAADVALSAEIDGDVLVETNRALGQEAAIRSEFAAADAAQSTALSAEIDGDVLVETNRALGQEAAIRSEYAAADAALQASIDALDSSEDAITAMLNHKMKYNVASKSDQAGPLSALVAEYSGLYADYYVNSLWVGHQVPGAPPVWFSGEMAWIQPMDMLVVKHGDVAPE